MISPADLLELIHGAPSRFSTMQAAVRRWEHPARFLSACERAGLFGTATGVSCLPGGTPDEVEFRGRLWLKGLHAFRVEERREGTGDRVVAGDGDHWFMQTSGGQLVAGDDGRPSAEYNSLADEVMTALYPRRLDYQPIGSTEHAGRRCIRVRARDSEIPKWRTSPGEFVGDERELLVDADRGVLLRVESRMAGEAFYVAELNDVVFDAPVPDVLFALGPRPGVDVLTYAEYEAYPWPSLAEAVERARFTVLVPDHPLVAGLEVFWSGAPGEPGEVQLRYRRGDDTLLQLRETSAASPPAMFWDGETLVRNDQTVTVAGSGDTTVARLVKHGTYVVLQGSLGRERIIDLAADLVPVSEPTHSR